VFKNGILKVSVPPKDEAETPEGIKIEIMKDSE
jgi:HSP20 family molecular chaperone IbpA